jgi:thiamine-monophosphate kinase
MVSDSNNRSDEAVKPSDEFQLIRTLLRKQRPSSQVVVGVGDDAAVVRLRPGMELVATCDAMVQGPHFTRQTMSPYDIGWKAMAANLSDLAAMAAEPRFALVTLGVNEEWAVDELVELYAGLYDLAERYDVQVVGGDTVSSPGGLCVSMTLLGEVAAGHAWLRSAAKAGDQVFVTGPLGGSAAGLHALLNPRLGEAWEQTGDAGRLAAILQMHQRPLPRVEAGRVLAALPFGGALNDVSDGLASEAWEIAEASQVAVWIEEAALPIAEPVRDFARFCQIAPEDWALYGGEDFQLLGTVPADAWPMLEQAFRERGLPVYRCGEVQAGFGVFLKRQDGSAVPVAKLGYNHFTKRE